MIKVVFGAVFGGLAMFLWGAVGHLVLPLGQIGIQQLPAEDAITATLEREVGGSGLYLFPGVVVATADEAEVKAWEAKYRKGPRGLLVYTAEGAEPMSPLALGKQLGGDIVAAFFGAILLWLAGMARYTSRVVFTVLIGVAAWATISLPYWNWYGFPIDFTLATGANTALRWLAAGLVMGVIVRPGR